MNDYLLVVGRGLLGLLFIVTGFSSGLSLSGTAGMIESVGFPMATILAVVVVAMKLGGGFSVLLGWKARYGAGTLIVFTLLATAFFHLDFTDPMQITAMLKNLAIIGGLLLVAVHGAGPFALENKRAPVTTHPSTS